MRSATALMDRWPPLRYDEWTDTLQTVQLWTQIVGKIRLQLEFLVNHWWNVTLYVTPRGLTTSAMAYRDICTFSIDFDFVCRRLCIEDDRGNRRSFSLEPMPVAEFYRRLMRELESLGIEVRINKKPNEVTNPIPFDRDTIHNSYDGSYVERFFKALLQADRLCKRFRSSFVGKASPVHFFWGSFDLATTRFSGRSAPPHPGGIPNLPDWATREAYSHEEFSVGFWPGGPGIEAAFYAYAYPEPVGFGEAKILPSAAAWNTALREFILPYDAVRRSSDPDRGVLEFFTSAYEAAADLAGWDRTALERRAGVPR